MTAIQTLCEIIAQRGPASRHTFQDHVGFDLLSTLALIRNSGVVQSVVCEACDDPHDVPVVYEDGQYGHYCGDAGFVTLAAHQLDLIEQDASKLVARLAEAFGCKRLKTSPVYNETWRVGALETNAGDLTIYWQPTMLDQNDIRDLNAALSHEMRSQFTLVLTADGNLTEAGTKTTTLDEIILLSDDGHGFTVLADPCEIVGAPRTAQGGQHSPYAANLDSLMKERVSSSCALSGRNEEARALKALYKERHPEKDQPSMPTVKRHVTHFRARS